MLQRSTHKSSHSNKQWSPHSWRDYPIKMQPVYENGDALAAVLDVLTSVEGLTSLAEISSLKKSLKKVSAGEIQVLHAGDCAERFIDGTRENVLDRVNLLKDGARILGDATLILARMGGQYFKPRSFDFESDLTTHVYRGDGINGFNQAARKPDEQRLLKAYQLSSFVNNIVRDESNFFLTHEGLHLLYEEALLRKEKGIWYGSSAPLLWIGERTRNLHEAHVEFFRGVANPVAVKLGPTVTQSEVQNLCDKLNPDDESGKLVLIPRLGLKHVSEQLQRIIESVEGRSVTWILDVVHGNTVRDTLKKRCVADILKELSIAQEIFDRKEIHFGVHVEVTPENVHECIDTVEEEPSLSTSYCDPRLNAQQFFRVLKAAHSKLLH